MSGAIDAALRAAVGAEIAPILDELRLLRGKVEELHAATRPPELESLHAILNCTPGAALARASRDPELRSRGVRLGRRLVYRRHEIVELLASRARGGL